MAKKTTTKSGYAYGVKRDKKSERNTGYKLYKFLKQNNIKVKNDKYFKNYVKAVDYGGYTTKDVLTDIQARRQGKEGNVHPTMKRAAYFKKRPGRFADINKRHDLDITKPRNKAFPKPKASKNAASTTISYIGTGKFGELPKKDSHGHYSWIDETGQRQTQDGFELGDGETGWEYLGKHSMKDFAAGEALFQADPPPKPIDQMDDFEKQEYLDQAHKEISQNFLRAVKEGQQDTIYQMGSALSNYKQTMDQENMDMDQDVRDTINAMEASGLSFTGKAKEELGDFGAASGVLAPGERDQILKNIAAINEIRKGDVALNGEGVSDLERPKPDGIDDPSLTEAEKDQKWKDFFETDTWKNYVDKLNTASGNDPNETGASGTGTYGLGDQMNRLANTRAYEGNVMKKHRLIQEGSRSSFNNQIQSLGTQAESSLGSNNLTGLTMPTIGGKSIYNPAKSVLGTEQSSYLGGGGNYGQGVYGRAGELAGNDAEQYSYTFNV